jgi:hypothetical protein
VPLLGATTTLAIPTITAVGNKFFTSDGNQFFLKGMNGVIQPRSSLTRESNCSFAQELHTN